MGMTLITFILFTILVAIASYKMTGKEDTKTTKGYFLAGGGLTGIIIAGSMLLTNLSAEQLIGLNGSSYADDLVQMAWEVTAANAAIMMACYFLPKYLKGSFTTLPEFLKDRYDDTTRKMISILFLVGYIFITMPSALYSGAIAFSQLFNLGEIFGIGYVESITILIVIIGIVGAIYAIFGGLKAVAVSDTINGVGLLIGGLLVPIVALIFIGKGNFIDGFTTVISTNTEKLNSIGGSHSSTPFNTIFSGMIFANLSFWCTNQVIIQRAFAAKNLKEGQKGIILTGFMKILVPVIMCFPGVLAFHIFGEGAFAKTDMAYPALVMKVIPTYLHGFFAAVMFGAVLSTFNSFLNSASTIFCLDLYKPSKFGKNISDEGLIKIAKKFGVIAATVSIMIAPMLLNASDGIFLIVRRFTGVYNIPIITLVLVGLLTKRVPAIAAKIGVIVYITFYILLVFVLKININYIHIMGVGFILAVGTMLVIGKIKPRETDYEITEVKRGMDMTPWRFIGIASVVTFYMMVLAYLVLSPIGVAAPVGEQFNSTFKLWFSVTSVVALVIGYIAHKYNTKKIAEYRSRKDSASKEPELILD
jgi:SSS family solute:Na+ symporter